MACPAGRSEATQSRVCVSPCVGFFGFDLSLCSISTTRGSGPLFRTLARIMTAEISGSGERSGIVGKGVREYAGRA